MLKTGLLGLQAHAEHLDTVSGVHFGHCRVTECNTGVQCLLFCCRYALSNWNVFRACMRREFIIMKRNGIVFGFRIVQVRTIYLSS